MKLRLTQLKQRLDDWQLPLERLAARALRIRESEVVSAKLRRKSVDARDKSDVHFTLTLDVETARLIRPLPLGAEALSEKSPSPGREAKVTARPLPPHRNGEVPRRGGGGLSRPVVVGLGPAGLFAGLTLAEAGLDPIVIERGRPVDQREKDVEAFWNGGALDPMSNVQFGEGGAGAFSDGKLNSGIKDPRCRRVLETLHAAGAPEEILYQAKPHIGTDNLKRTVKGIRERIIALGGTVRFETTLTGLRVEGDQITGAVVDDGEVIPTRHVILAVGHSARDTFEWLNEMGVRMSRKPFAIGARIEHRQADINRAQYGRFADHPALGAADYKLSVHLPGGRSVYTFCMCPGGMVVAAASEAGGAVVNGMSLFARDGENANSALLVDCAPAGSRVAFRVSGVPSGIVMVPLWSSTTDLGLGAPAACAGVAAAANPARSSTSNNRDAIFIARLFMYHSPPCSEYIGNGEVLCVNGDLWGSAPPFQTTVYPSEPNRYLHNNYTTYDSGIKQSNAKSGTFFHDFGSIFSRHCVAEM